jgi:blue copper oxidase
MLTRRHFLAATALTGAAMVARSSAACAAGFATLLPIPQLIDAKAHGNAVSLTIGPGTHAYRTGQPVRSFGYSAPVLGPVIRLTRGESVDVSIENRLGRPTTLHWHGLIVPGAVDGGPHNTIAAGRSWKVNLHVDQPETTAWYHPHPHGETGEQVYSGLAGMLMVDDGSGERLGLPRNYGVDDLPLVLQDRFFDRSGAPVYRPGPMDVMAGYRGDSIIVNGVEAPVARVPAGLVRVRLLNGANARFFDLYFSDDRTFQVIASDGGYLPAPVDLRRLLVAPGERYEVVVDFANGAEVELRTGPDRNVPMMGMMRGGTASAPGGSVMKFEVDRSKPAAATKLPGRLAEVPLLDRSKVVARRQFLLNDMMMGGMMGRGMMGGGMMGPGRGRRGFGPVMAINGQPFDMERIDVQAKRGTLELWEIGAPMMAHPFHVHGTQFQILSLNGEVPPLHMQGWKDTVIVARQAQILVPLTQPAPPDKPFMFHCHILEHEDAGMMGQYACV